MEKSQYFTVVIHTLQKHFEANVKTLDLISEKRFFKTNMYFSMHIMLANPKEEERRLSNTIYRHNYKMKIYMLHYHNDKQIVVAW